ncbi:hypothetical protein EVAR_96550_1 [Eumeta japonica]|uniref:Transposable element P transposase-like RNase H domain-containing protein n=1 Tax=Eumeta variegata TaxID=151549 RepID=A0A4C1WFG3_EUMVA|nr:hypothetical protein EVAR_96550_1 [Eumeta japonica]
MTRLEHETSQKSRSNIRKHIKNNQNVENEGGESPLDDRESSINGMVSPESDENLNTFESFDDFIECLTGHKFGDWYVIEKGNTVLFANISLSDVPTIDMSAMVNTNLEVKIFKGKDEIQNLNGNTYPIKVTSIKEIEIILNDLSSLSSVRSEELNENINTSIALLQEVRQHNNKVQDKVSFLCEQMNLLLEKRQSMRRFSIEYMIFSCILWLISPHAYKYLCTTQLLVLPFVSILHKICPKPYVFSNLEGTDPEFLIYVKEKVGNLQPEDMVVSLTVEEIRLRPYFNEIDDDVLQKAFNITRKAKTAQIYTINSLCSSFKEIVHILPIKEMDSDTLFLMVKKIIIGLHDIGFSVVCVVSNNSLINKGAMSNFVTPPATQIVYKHPVDQNKPLFYIFDSTHILKNIRNYWANQADELLLFPKFNSGHDKVLVADFSIVKKHSENENSKSIKSVLNIFNKSTIEALKENDGKSHNQTTAEFMEIILKWWSIMKSKVCSENVSEDHKFLEDCLVWLDHWANLELVENKFSDETHEAFTHTIYAFLQLTEYCQTELKLGRVLPSKIQTDSLEARYGRFRTTAIYDTATK